MKRALEAIQNYRNIYIIMKFTVVMLQQQCERVIHILMYLITIFFCCCPSELLNNMV